LNNILFYFLIFRTSLHLVIINRFQIIVDGKVTM
jgi:hypothetical protein